MDREKLLITPQTRVGELLDSYPELEDLLISMAPAFKKLRHPVLRRTVAKVTSLAQAARVGGVPVASLVQQLRQAAGQPAWTAPESEPTGAASAGDHPLWLKPDSIHQTFDARPLIESGEQPVGRVMRELTDLPPGRIYELITPFEPAPLIDKARSRGFMVWCEAREASDHRTYFYRE